MGMRLGASGLGFETNFTREIDERYHQAPAARQARSDHDPAAGIDVEKDAWTPVSLHDFLSFDDQPTLEEFGRYLGDRRARETGLFLKSVRAIGPPLRIALSRARRFKVTSIMAIRR